MLPIYDIQPRATWRFIEAEALGRDAGSVPVRGHAQRPRSSVSRDEEWKELVHVSRIESQ